MVVRTPGLDTDVHGDPGQADRVRGWSKTDAWPQISRVSAPVNSRYADAIHSRC
jgi:hypothetical protein